MRVFDETKTNELTNYDLEKGYLKEDKLLVAYHAEKPEIVGSCSLAYVQELMRKGVEVINIEERWYRVVSRTGKARTIERIWEISPQKGHAAYNEYEDIQVYIPYTTEELEKRKEKKYKNLVSRYIREKYSLDDELAILRKRVEEPAEFEEYFTYAEECKQRAKLELEG